MNRRVFLGLLGAVPLVMRQTSRERAPVSEPSARVIPPEGRQTDGAAIIEAWDHVMGDDFGQIFDAMPYE